MKNMNLLLSIFIIVWASLSGCERSNDCHRSFKFVNTTQDSVLLGTVVSNGLGECSLGYVSGISVGNEAEISYRTCLEDKLSSKELEFYIVDPAHFNDQQEFYSCDSIEVKNKVLKKYTISLGELQNNNFTVTYP